MKTRLKLFALLLAAAAFAALPILAADSIDTMTRKVTGSTSAAGLTSKSIGAYALVSKDNTIAISAYGGALSVEGANLDNHQTSVRFSEPTADRTITFSDATGRVELIAVTAEAATATLTAAECQTPSHPVPAPRP